MWSTALRSSLSSKSLAASICITYANRATVYYTIGIYLVGLMTGTKGDDAACTVRGRDHLRYASLFSPSPFFFSLPRRLRLKYFPSRATLHTYIYTYTRLYTRFDEIRGRTNIAAGTIPEKVCFFPNRAGRVGNRTGLYRRKLDSGRFPPLEISNSVTRRVSTLDIENRLWPIPKTMHDSEPVILRTRKRSWPRNVRFPCIGLIEYSHDTELTRSQTN